MRRKDGQRQSARLYISRAGSSHRACRAANGGERSYFLTRIAELTSTNPPRLFWAGFSGFHRLSQLHVET